MEAIRHFLDVRRNRHGRGTEIGEEVWKPAYRKFHELGWRKDPTITETLDWPTPGRKHNPYWIDPESGFRIRGISSAMTFALRRYDGGDNPPLLAKLLLDYTTLPPLDPEQWPRPSERAVRVYKALQARPVLAEELGTLLTGEMEP